MIHFVGAGPGAEDLITARGQNLLRRADRVIYAGSLVNPALLNLCRADCEILDSSRMTLAEVIDALSRDHNNDSIIVRLHAGDPSIYGAIREQMDELCKLGVPFEVVPGVSAFCAAAAALDAEYTLPGVSQTVILTRVAGRTPVPEKEDIRSLAAHQASMALFLSAGMLPQLRDALLEGGYPADTPAALVYKASWPDERISRGTLENLLDLGDGITKTAMVLVGRFLGGEQTRSKLYDPAFGHGFREARV
ncbi:MAG: precorrin-4 C(11)-methyltransferase [Oscillospiraceae bacterium]|jgi:precorrin-4/cobalt-precorrin-4 C11-methyltransferase|nr:precorrin-4 C(11)-methyltransferase [Oscillospiraceae bacterium]